MPLLTLRSIGVVLGEPLFCGLDLSVAGGDRLGLVAANGRGKSTLMRCIAAETEPTTGDLIRARGLVVAHVAQDIPAELLMQTFRQVVLGALSGDLAESESWRADIVMDDLAIPDDLRERQIGALSGGWQRTAMLARAAVTEPQLLLLDEPTNHLDLARIGVLQRWLAGLPRDMGVILASHDRAFLDAATNRTLFLRPERSQTFALPYSRARRALDEADAADDRKFQNDLQKAQQLRRQAAKLKNIGINSGSDLLVIKTKQLSERATRLEEAARPAHQERSAGAIRLANSGTHARALVSFDNAEVTVPGGDLLFRTGKVWINNGDRVVLLGPNGAGKTRLVSMVRSALDGAGGAIQVAASVIAGVSDQMLGQIAGDRTAHEAITRRFEVGDQRARAHLAGAGIGIDLQSAPLSALSGGQLSRLAMLVLRLTNPNFYLLDEPTNHLDIEGQEALEAELLDKDASCLLVSHDRAFVRAVGTRYWLIERRRLVEIDDPEPVFDALMAG